MVRVAIVSCRRCREYKGILTCGKCKRNFCVFCEGPGPKLCPDCEDEE